MVINARCGGLSNRIVQIAHGMATAIANGEDILITEFEDLKEFYACNVTWNGKVEIRPSTFWSMERLTAELIRRILRCRVRIPGVVSDWYYRDYVGVEKCNREIRSFFEPRKEKIARVMPFRDWLFARGGKIVGVHVRRGDYKVWCNGRFYYDDEVYARNISAIAAELPASTFVLFSNEALNVGTFATCGATVLVSHGSTPVEDHWLMSQCDLLFGPPSTFSRWAAYMGRKPMAFIEDAIGVLRLDNFKYISI